MIRIHLQLYSILREKLPSDSHGQSEIEVADGTTLQNILDDLEIHRRVVISVNDVQETDKLRILKDGDQVKIFSSISGG